MSKAKLSRVAWLGSALCLIGLGGLAVGPFVFQKIKFTLRNSNGGEKLVAPSFSLDKTFPLLPSAPGKLAKKASLIEYVVDGQVLIVNFWASWCPPCVEELPSLEYLNRQLELKRASDPKTPRVVTINIDERPEDVWALYRTLDFSPTFAVLHDPNGTFATSVGTTKYPETYQLSAAGKVLYKWVGPQEWLSQDVLRHLSPAPGVANASPTGK